MKVTELLPIDTTASVRWSGENPHAVNDKMGDGE
jgi:hypothetical protein